MRGSLSRWNKAFSTKNKQGSAKTRCCFQQNGDSNAQSNVTTAHSMAKRLPGRAAASPGAGDVAHGPQNRQASAAAMISRIPFTTMPAVAGSSAPKLTYQG